MIPQNTAWLTLKPQGLYCIPGQFFIDPLSPVAKAIITHAHGDHARTGHQNVLATPETLMIMKVRYQERMAATIIQPIEYFKEININGVLVSLLPAGHILGSAQIVLTYQNVRIIISGDYKRRQDDTCQAFVVQHADLFITEATFGLPIFIHPPIEEEIQKLLTSLKENKERSHLIGVYALGKCQRLILALRKAGYDKPIYLHGALIKLCELYQSLGFKLDPLIPINKENVKTLAGEIILAPPSALHDRWSRRFSDAVISYASGWMQTRARAKQKGIELPLIISDHADWQELTQTLDEVSAKEYWITHGAEEGLLYYAEKKGLKAKPLALLHDDNEDN